MSSVRPLKVLQMIESNCYTIKLPLNFNIILTFDMKDLVLKHNLSLMILLKLFPYYPYLWHKRNIIILLWMHKLFLPGMLNFNES
jgi:hypothetical protein